MNEHFYYGHEHGIVEQEYLWDDEPIWDTDPELDQLAYSEWKDDQQNDEL